jgi:hypothetical protein
MKTTSPKSELTTGLRRGDPLPTGGRFIGKSRGGVTWVAYPADDFDAMCDLFDRAYSPAPSRDSVAA